MVWNQVLHVLIKPTNEVQSSYFTVFRGLCRKSSSNVRFMGVIYFFGELPFAKWGENMNFEFLATNPKKNWVEMDRWKTRSQRHKEKVTINYQNAWHENYTYQNVDFHSVWNLITHWGKSPHLVHPKNQILKISIST